MEQLTRQERKIVALVSQGLSNKEIAQRLGSSPFTVRNQVQVIIRKLELKNRIQVAFISNEISLTSVEDPNDILAESFTSLFLAAIISPPMAPKEVDPGDHLTEHISDLQSQANLRSEPNQRPSHYPHENVVFHVAQLRTEAQGKQRTERDTVKSYVVVASLRDAAERTGVADDDILTTSQIEAEYHLNKKLVHEYTQRGRRGRPHLTPLEVRLARGGGSSQLLFRRGDIESLVANPPKPGRTPK
jgi:DNA-binding CsgD family transcriptional regulator